VQALLTKGDKMAKKPTIRQLEERLNLVTSQLNFSTRMLESVGVAFSNFVRFLDKEEEFKKYLENNKNLHKLTKEENESRKEGHLDQNNAVSDKKVRKKDDEKK
tara:strand:- start:300 stop:611 length:312 start_codon:yes stop_codon:yes gene_type:complete